MVYETADMMLKPAQPVIGAVAAIEKTLMKKPVRKTKPKRRQPVADPV
jgi:hypothetical protein